MQRWCCVHRDRDQRVDVNREEIERMCVILFLHRSTHVHFKR